MMRYRHTQETLFAAPALEPVSVEEAAAHCRVSGHDDDEYLADLITAARQHLEEECWSAFVSQTWDFRWDAFSPQLYIPRPPLLSVTTFQYMDAAGTLTTVPAAAYEIGVDNGISYARTQYQQTWPTSRGHRDDVRMRAVCGYGAAATDVPLPVRQAIKLLVAHWYVNREPINIGNIVNAIPRTVDDLVRPYRMKGL